MTLISELVKFNIKKYINILKTHFTNYLNQSNNFIIIYLSDSKGSETNVPLRLQKIINKKSNQFKILFKHLNIYNIVLISFLIIKSRFSNQIILIHSHHLKSLILNFLFKLLSKILGSKIIVFHSFLCELRRFSNIKLKIFILSKLIVDEYVTVSNELKESWGNFLNRNINFIKIGISNGDKNFIEYKSIKYNKLIVDKGLNDKCLNITQVGRLEDVKRPLFIFDILYKVKLKNNQRIKFTIVGDGSLKSELIKKINSFNNIHCKNKNIFVEYLGFIERPQLLNLISKSNLFINTSSSEGCLVTAMEFLTNPFCKIILPDIKSIKEIYNCKRSFFYPKNEKDILLNHIQDNLDNFYSKNQNKFSYNYPIGFEDYILENSSENLISIYLKSASLIKN